jgi:hypothetical protein
MIPIYRGANDTFLMASLRWNHPYVIDLAERPAEGRYVRMLQVGDYGRLERHSPSGRAVDALDADDIADLKSGRSILVMDFANEGPGFSKPIWDSFHGVIEELGIAKDRVVVVQQNRDMETDYRLVYGLDGLRFCISDYFVKKVGFDFWLNGGNVTESREFQDIHYYPARSDEPGPIYICLNGALRWLRVVTYRYLSLTQILEKGLVSFHGAGPDNPKANEIDLSASPVEQGSPLTPYIDGVEAWIPRQAIRFDGREEKGNVLANIYIPHAYQSTCFSIVTESDFFGSDIDRITEKTMKAACMGHPLVILGPAGALKALRKFGFRSFPELFDESYDEIEDPAERFLAAMRTAQAAIANIEADRAGWNRRASSSAIYNYEHGRSGFMNFYKGNIENDIINLMNEHILGGPILP